jgi:hypothetical protein
LAKNRVKRTRAARSIAPPPAVTEFLVLNKPPDPTKTNEQGANNAVNAPANLINFGIGMRYQQFRENAAIMSDFDDLVEFFHDHIGSIAPHGKLPRVASPGSGHL